MFHSDHMYFLFRTRYTNHIYFLSVCFINFYVTICLSENYWMAWHMVFNLTHERFLSSFLDLTHNEASDCALLLVTESTSIHFTCASMSVAALFPIYAPTFERESDCIRRSGFHKCRVFAVHTEHYVLLYSRISLLWNAEQKMRIK